MTMAASLGVPPLYTGGAVLAGVFFGDRCSPVSTSALLVSELTKTDLYSNISAMVKTALAPFLISCVLYWLLGLSAGDGGVSGGAQAVFEESYQLSALTLLPVAAVLVLSLMAGECKIYAGGKLLPGNFDQRVPPGGFLDNASRPLRIWIPSGRSGVGRLYGRGRRRFHGAGIFYRLYFLLLFPECSREPDS